MINTSVTVTKMTNNITKVTIGTCPRCGEMHEDLIVYSFDKPIEINDIIFKHYTMCPELNEPILIEGLDFSLLAC